MNKDLQQNRVRELRKKSKMTQKELGIALGYSESTISKYESNSIPLDSTNLLLMANFFDTSVDYLLGRENKNEVIERTEQRPALTSNEQEFLNALNTLNAIGKIKAMAYIQGLQTSKEFIN